MILKRRRQNLGGVLRMRGTPRRLKAEELGGIAQKFVIVDSRKLVRIA